VHARFSEIPPELVRNEPAWRDRCGAGRRCAAGNAPPRLFLVCPARPMNAPHALHSNARNLGIHQDSGRVGLGKNPLARGPKPFAVTCCLAQPYLPSHHPHHLVQGFRWRDAHHAVHPSAAPSLNLSMATPPTAGLPSRCTISHRNMHGAIVSCRASMSRKCQNPVQSHLGCAVRSPHCLLLARGRSQPNQQTEYLVMHGQGLRAAQPRLAVLHLTVKNSPSAAASATQPAASAAPPSVHSACPSATAPRPAFRKCPPPG
jgi:hypothetical protein